MIRPTKEGNAPDRIQLVLRTVYGNQYDARHAYIDLDTQLFSQSSQLVYEDAVKDQRNQDNVFGTDIADLQTVAQALLGSTVDRMLDKPAFRAALSHAQRSDAGA